MCSRWLALAALGACSSIDVPLAMTTGTANVSELLQSNLSTPSGIGLQWDLVEQPPGSTVSSPSGDPDALFVPDRRGAYLLDVSLTSGLSEELAERIEVVVGGVQPTAAITVQQAGASITLDGSQSASPEGLSLTYHWRLVSRPEASAAQLATPDQAVTTMTADADGDYAVELDTFDGELWSMPANATVTVQGI